MLRTLATSPRRRTLALALAATACAALLAACTADPAPAPTSSTTPAPAADEADAAPVASAVATLPDERGTVDVDVRSLTLDDNGTTMTLRVDFTAHLTTPDGDATLSEINNFFFLHPVLLDRQNLKRYSVVEGEGSQDWLTNDDTTAPDGEPLHSWFVYAAPEDDVDEVAVTIDEWGVEIPGVPVTS
ncbi:hypothetical protein [Cellulomonas fimi]|uniref:Lipoprotein n=1 Tax=Cellulomonas fimi (strain ATCC 484 / DSM 20113 / JCM 1341 / CCUG 24087 / LMG 16345 / NBRC 15513 / NCIMB 8980 / NCTC 7547 / NRS-133) TaxID=590998 RepID=F4H4Z7_CELFA|nr:hypothetical protein [Cellulomonas fimi]AEE45477.1 hypothetical protein Celf_1342 [Cellulomonas fimi ATCC 484]NNH07297.1 hypothetical protein [Cellulomonas fimi]VEH29537.1 Uncharacterised protein [Cellulomonas fimi]